MAYREVFKEMKGTCPNIHVESAYDGWIWFFSNEKLIACYNDYTGELVDMREVA